MNLLPNEHDLLADAAMERAMADALISDLRSRIAELEAADCGEVEEFNAGYAAYEAGEPVDSEPSSTTYDQWRLGWAWAAFEPTLARIKKQAENMERIGRYANSLSARTANEWAVRCAELEAMLSRLEWIIPGRYTPGDFCPICDNDTGWGHTDDCELDALLPKETTDD